MSRAAAEEETTVGHALAAPDALRRLVDMLPVAAAVVDGERVVANARADALLGRPPGDGEPTPLDAWFRGLYGDRAAAERAAYDAARRRGFPASWIAELRRARAGETPRRVEVAAQETDGLVVWTLQDVTAHVHAVQAQRGSEAQLRGFFDAPGVYFCVLDIDAAADDFVYVMPNRAFAAAYGLTVEALAGKRGADLALPRDRVSRWVEVLRRCRETGEPVTLELNPAGTVRPVWVLANITRIGDNADGRALLAYVATDITERKLLEEQFRQAQKMEAVGRLAGGVAHDFNNLLTVIGGSAEFLLAECPPGDPRRDDVLEIGRAAERARDLTRQLLAFGRRQVVQPRWLDVNALVADAERMLGRLIGEDVALTTSLAPDTPAVYADPGRIEQALVNLVVNARDAMPNGGRLVVSTSRAVGDGEYAVLSVRDSGVGMDESTQARIFEPFFTTKEPGKGTGLGLSTVFGIVTQAGGRVTVDSALGRGTTFHLHLPAAAGGAAPAADAPTTAVGAGSETVLIVEDEPQVRRLARRALERRGYTVLEAGDGAEALAVSDARHAAIDLVLADAVLPEQGGRQVVDALRARRPGLAALFMSGYAQDEVLRQHVAASGAPFVQKPFTSDQLAAAVRAVLDARARRAR